MPFLERASGSAADKDAEAYDDWVEKEEYLPKYFTLSSWQVDWTGIPLP